MLNYRHYFGRPFCAALSSVISLSISLKRSNEQYENGDGLKKEPVGRWLNREVLWENQRLWIARVIRWQRKEDRKDSKW